MGVRVRYAPSPTGLQHIGGLRTALFNYFFARSKDGRFLLRIEDTDRERFDENALEDLYETFRWLGIQWDEGPDCGGEYGPYIQSQRIELYREYARRLVENGHAYYCYCTPERIEKLRIEQKKNRQDIGYDRKCRHLTDTEINVYKSEGIKPVIRLLVPLDEETVMHDLILGDIKKKNSDINPDPVLLKSDGYPTYHLANVIDDHFMNITHIMRAQEWIPSGPLHLILYKAFGWKPPVYCHLPMVMGSDGQKLSKRHGATAVKDFREKGYLPEALINYISLIGWSYDDAREFFTKEELEKLFTIDKLNKAPGVFDYKKLDWFNGNYIRKKSDSGLKELLIPFMIKAGLVTDPPTEEQDAIIDGVLPLIKERIKTLAEVKDIAGFLFKEIESYSIEDLIPKKINISQTINALEELRAMTDKIFRQNEEKTEEDLKKLAVKLGIKLGDLIMPLRVAVTGSRMSPPIIASVKQLGLEKTNSRLDRVIEILKNEDNDG